MTGISTAIDAARVLDDSAIRAPAIAAALGDEQLELIRYGRGVLTTGIPRFTWNGLDDSGRLFPGIHPATAAEVQLRFAWNEPRAAMYDRMRTSLAHLRDEHPHLRHVVGGGSYFSAKPKPGDVDLALLAEHPGVEATRMLNQRDPWVHVYPARGYSNGVPQYMTEFFRFERPFMDASQPITRWSRPSPGAERGLVLMDLDDLL